MGHGQHVENRIGRSAQGNDHRDGVLEGLARDDVRRKYAALEQIDHGRARISRVRLFVSGYGGLR